MATPAALSSAPGVPGLVSKWAQTTSFSRAGWARRPMTLAARPGRMLLRTRTVTDAPPAANSTAPTSSLTVTEGRWKSPSSITGAMLVAKGLTAMIARAPFSSSRPTTRRCSSWVKKG